MWAHQPSPEGSQQLYLVLKVMTGIAKSTTTLAHMITLYTMGLTKGFHSSHLASAAAQQQTIHMSSAATHPRHAPEPNGANESHRRVSKPDRKTVVPNYSAFGIYWNPSLTHHPHNSLSNAPPNPET